MAIDSGADYTDTESPHYLNYYRRTVAHNSVLVYDPAEKFFWSDNLWPAANDGGQRMDSCALLEHHPQPRGLESHPRLVGSGHQCESSITFPASITMRIGDATHAYARNKLRSFTRELVYIPGKNLLFVFDRVVSTNPAFRKAWLLHGVNQPAVDHDNGGGGVGAQEFSPS